MNIEDENAGRFYKNWTTLKFKFREVYDVLLGENRDMPYFSSLGHGWRLPQFLRTVWTHMGHLVTHGFGNSSSILFNSDHQAGYYTLSTSLQALETQMLVHTPEWIQAEVQHN